MLLHQHLNGALSVALSLSLFIDEDADLVLLREINSAVGNRPDILALVEIPRGVGAAFNELYMIFILGKLLVADVDRLIPLGQKRIEDVGRFFYIGVNVYQLIV